MKIKRYIPRNNGHRQSRRAKTYATSNRGNYPRVYAQNRVNAVVSVSPARGPADHVFDASRVRRTLQSGGFARKTRRPHPLRIHRGIANRFFSYNYYNKRIVYQKKKNALFRIKNSKHNRHLKIIKKKSEVTC